MEQRIMQELKQNGFESLKQVREHFLAIKSWLSEFATQAKDQ